VITIVDYGMGNIGSVANMIRHVGGESRITSDPDAVAEAERLILPGVGHFDAGMKALRATGLDTAVSSAARRGATLLGICLGMQLLLEESEEGVENGLGLVPGQARKFALNGRMRVPHMGWAPVRPIRASRLFPPTPGEQRFYFVHSYHAACARPEDVVGVTEYGQTFVSAYERDNILGVQFHPEKSHKFGMALFRTFLGC
jgi:glutamine amidotransferase